MKNLIITLIATLTLHAVNAQSAIEKDQLTYKKEITEALMLKMNIPTDNSKDLFSEFMSERYNTKVKGLGFLSNRDDLLIKNAHLIAFKIDPVSFIVKFTDVANGNTSVKFAAMDAKNRFITEAANAEDYKALRALMEEFNDFALKTYVASEVDKYTEELKDKQKDLRKAQEDIKSHQEDIAKKQKEITDHKREVEDLELKSTALSKRIKELNDSINATKGKLRGGVN